MMYYLLYDKIGLLPFCFLGPAYGCFHVKSLRRGGGSLENTFVGHLEKPILVTYDPS
jgi:hypothetical protein